MSRAIHTLRIAGPAGAVFRVTDGAARCVGTGMHRLAIDLPQGIYTVNASLGRSVETREVLLDEPHDVELHTTLPSFGDRAFGLAPEVLAALGVHEFCPGGQLIALRGPWRDAQAAAERVTLKRDGRAVAALREGLLPDPGGSGVWSWQLFDLGPVRAGAAGPAVFGVTRSVHDTAAPRPDPAVKGTKKAALPQKVSHLLPHWGDWVVWAAYPASGRGAAESAELPMAYYLRLRLAPPGAVPQPHLQSLSDQVFTALAARTGLPLTEPVLDLLLAPDAADPLLTLAAAHLASITLASLGRLQRLPHDGAASPPQGASNATPNELQMIDTEALYRRFHAWLDKQGSGPLSTQPDVVAVRFLFGIGTVARLRVPPVLLRSLDGLIAAADSALAKAAGTTCDESVWGPRLQISDSFAFLQWQADADYKQELLNIVRRSFESLQAMQSTARLIEQARDQVAQEKKDAAEASPAQPLAPVRRSASRGLKQAAKSLQQVVEKASAAQPTSGQAAASQPGLDLEAFIKSNVTSLRIPASAMTHLGTVLGSLSIDQKSIAQAMRQLAARVKKD